MILLLDTTVMIDALRNRQGRLEYLDQLVRTKNKLATSAVNIGEVYGGLRLGEEMRTELFLTTVRVYPATNYIARRAGLLKSTYGRRGITLAITDMIVAATALEYSLPLLTDNRRHFPMPELTLYPLPSNT